MKRITAPQPGQAALEDIQIQYFEFDEAGNVAVVTKKLSIPTSTGRFAAAAMLKGYFDNYDFVLPGGRELSDEGKAFRGQVESDVREWATMLESHKAELTPQNKGEG